MDVSQLTDVELRESLKTHGVSVGPIVASTRKVYEKKLLKLAGGDGNKSANLNDTQKSAANGDVDQHEASFSPIFKNVAAKPASPKSETKVTRRSGARSTAQQQGQQQQPQSSSTRSPESDSDDECEESMRYLTEEEMAADRAALQRSFTTNTSAFKVTRASIMFWAFVIVAITFMFFSVDNYVYSFIEESKKLAMLQQEEDPV